MRPVPIEVIAARAGQDMLLPAPDPLDAGARSAGGDVGAPAGESERGAVGCGALSLVIPWPPSVNTIWRHVVIRGAARVLLSAEGREYRQRVARIIGPRRPVAVPVSVMIRAHPPDRRRRDIDNVLKAALDALTHAGVWDDDQRVADLRIVRMFPAQEPRLEVVVEVVDCS